jgi:hypothetical protein
MLDMIETEDFNIFDVRRDTKENELITSITFLLHKNRIF